MINYITFSSLKLVAIQGPLQRI